MCRLNMRAAVAAANLKMAAVTWMKNDGVAAKEMMASDRRGSVDLCCAVLYVHTGRNIEKP